MNKDIEEKLIEEERIIGEWKMGEKEDVVLLDFNEEEKREKKWFGNFVDGREREVVGKNKNVKKEE